MHKILQWNILKSFVCKGMRVNLVLNDLLRYSKTIGIFTKPPPCFSHISLPPFVEFIRRKLI